MDLSISHKPRCRMASGGVAQRLGMLVKNNYAQRNELLGAFEGNQLTVSTLEGLTRIAKSPQVGAKQELRLECSD